MKFKPVSRLRKQKHWIRNTLAVVFACCIIAELCVSSGILMFLERPVYDTYHRLAGVKSWYVPHVVIVSIDTESLMLFDQDPLVFWGPHLAGALSAIRDSGARTAGIDIIFSISPESWLQKTAPGGSDIGRSYDMAFRRQLNFDDVILTGHAVWTKNGNGSIILPVAEYLYALPDGPASVGLSNIHQDDDGVTRFYITRLFDDQKPPDMTFAPLLASKSGFSSKNTGLTRIGYAGPPGTIPRLPFRDLVGPDKKDAGELKKILQDKIVIVSVEEGGNNDAHLTPYSGGLFTPRGIKLMSGAEIHANIIESIISGRVPSELPRSVRISWLVIIVFAGALLCRMFGPGAGSVLVISLAAGSAAVSWVMFLHDMLLPVAPVVLALFLCYLGIMATRLTREEKDRIQLETIFSPYVSETLLMELVNREKKPALGGEEREITVLFSDIRNFTTLSETLSPEEVVEMLNNYYGLICDVITRHGGMVDKFIGDAVMAIFGAPVSHPDHAGQSIRAALEMAGTAETFKDWMNTRFSNRKIPVFTIGIGIHTGKALIGNIGSKRRMEYTAIGDTINVAARLEGLCKNLGWTITASRITIDAAHANILTGRKDRIKPRGRTGSLDIVEILGIQAT